MNWQPSPSDYTSVPPPPKYGDTDFANDDFAALWGASGRDDLKTIKGLGCNTVKMYTIGHPAPNGYWKRNHKSFLNHAKALGLSVILPISNYFIGEDRKNRTSRPPNPLDIKSMVFDIVAEVYADGTPGSAVMWAIGNEYDLIPNGANGFFQASDIATVASYIIAAENRLNIKPENALAFTSPVSAATVPLNKSIPCYPPFQSLGGGCAIHAIIQEFKNLGIDSQRFVAGVNIYEVRQQLVNYFEAFPKVLPNVPMFHGELGWSAANGGEGKQAENITSQFSTIVSLAQKGSYFFGACCFEFSDELWKGPPNTSETKFGIYTFGQSKHSASQGNHSPVSGAQYPVDQLAPRPAVTAFQNAVRGSSNSLPHTDNNDKRKLGHATLAMIIKLTAGARILNRSIKMLVLTNIVSQFYYTVYRCTNSLACMRMRREHTPAIEQLIAMGF